MLFSIVYLILAGIAAHRLALTFMFGVRGLRVREVALPSDEENSAPKVLRGPAAVAVALARDTSRSGFSIGEFAEAGGDLGPIDAVIEGSFGSTRYFGDPCEIFDYYSFGRPGLEAALEPRKWSPAN